MAKNSASPAMHSVKPTLQGNAPKFASRQPFTGNSFSNSTNTQHTNELKMLLDETVKERDFYYNKLRDIEEFIQQKMDPTSELFKIVNEILYATEEGFEIPSGNLASKP
jgi:hypothetical protein